MRYIGAFIIALTLCLPWVASAESITTDLSLETIPINPEPGETVTIRATSYGGDLSQATLTWVYNNVQIAKAIGKTSVGVVAPASGSTGVVTVTASGVGFDGVSASVVLRPASVDVLWEAVGSYTPPFYKGKALLAPNGLIKFTAIPSPSAPKGLSFDWSRNGSALPDDSGYNKASVVFAHSEFNKQELGEVSIHGGVFTGSGSARVTPQDPQILTYRSKQGFIEYANGYTDSINLTQSGVVLHFEPYYFSAPQGPLAALSFDMKIDGQSVTPTKANEVGLSRPSQAGKSILELLITPFTYSLQHAQKTITLIFN